MNESNDPALVDVAVCETEQELTQDSNHSASFPKFVTLSIGVYVWSFEGIPST